MSKEELIKYIKGLTEITKENNKRGIEVGVEISVDMAEQLLYLIEKQQKEIENSYKVKFKVGEKAKLANGMSIGYMEPNHNKEVTIREITIRKGYIDYYVDYIKDGEIHNFRCNLQERDLVKLEE